MALDYYGDDEGEGEASRRFTEFECPECDATNPWDDGFGDGDEVLCYYCGMSYKVQVSEGGKLKLVAQ
jgi:transcription elongation factor Elf1